MPRSTPSSSASWGSRWSSSAVVDQREQLRRLVPPGARGVQLDLADDVGEGAGRQLAAVMPGTSAGSASGFFDPGLHVGDGVLSRLFTLTSRILSGS